MFNRKLKDDVVRLTYRVKELEERLCPCESHDWVQVGYRYVMNCPGDLDTIYKYKCRKCGKEKESLI